jgi:hypothetical protein
MAIGWIWTKGLHFAQLIAWESGGHCGAPPSESGVEPQLKNSFIDFNMYL